MSKQPQITVVGLGTGDPNQLTLGVWRKLESAGELSGGLYLRTREHPMVSMLDHHGLTYETFDSVYEASAEFDTVYETIASTLLARAQAVGAGEVLYAVPGHPMVAERTVQLLRERCAAEGVLLGLMGGESFLDQAFLRLGFDPIEGFQLLDGTSLQASSLNPQLHTLIGQVYDVHTASDVKLTLMELYPDDYPVTVGHSLGVTGEERVHEVPLYELDRVEGYGNLSLVWVPRTDREDVRSRTFARLHEIVDILRSPEGCPWDREQTHKSLRKNLIEEAYEVLETIDDDDPDHMCEELGDLLLQIMLHSQIEAEAGSFTVFDVIRELNEKLIRRHPHVFGSKQAEDADEALSNWQQIKDEEKRSKGIDLNEQSVLTGVPRELPGLMKAYKLQKKAAGVGFDWSTLDEVLPIVESELAEVKEAIERFGKAEQQEELGDLLFAVVNLARFLKVEPEEAMADANRKFFDRFSYIESNLRLKGKSFEQTDLQEMESLWQEAKKVLKK
ncbi:MULTISPECIES: nucleoside triphosphate pyrophosphohydrolase [unclassified Paenibacillus]|uniref:nucleoside triphosphate pyrophosphohydrolase n=1 Tax=unclassified Paenibacillus TaxID=185978 RepID=UPI001AE9485E|nr:MULTISPECIES: nucleoside triphosphate pyrophosphohydrolase [unclassified Paenibacillus]MBP1153487.1 tetrapyrrole methylase family protein/MazG family protein [Paenibacillus sp. PvP091]MBP1171130.1 tetrapyrrole methylase family protein/MazG family protein [Paenibacillus sp. PvR098]MBP2442158.1 tetrapyrrole methylase family protein/MazG family protein [Paenibacillus sp. PvP052]